MKTYIKYRSVAYNKTPDVRTPEVSDRPLNKSSESRVKHDPLCLSGYRSYGILYLLRFVFPGRSRTACVLPEDRGRYSGKPGYPLDVEEAVMAEQGAHVEHIFFLQMQIGLVACILVSLPARGLQVIDGFVGGFAVAHQNPFPHAAVNLAAVAGCASFLYFCGYFHNYDVIDFPKEKTSSVEWQCKRSDFAINCKMF